MDVPPEDQNSQHGQEVPSTKQPVIQPHIVPLLPTFHGMESENLFSYIKEFEEDKAKIWLNYLRPRSIRTWTDLQAEFLKKYMEAINACPHHDFDTWLLVSYFYDGMSSSMKQLLETMCGGDFMSKNLEEAMDFLNYVVEVSRGWDKPNAREAKFAAMVRRLEELEMKKVQEVQAISETPVQAMPCSICQSYEHLVDECPTIPAVREMFGDQANVIGQFKPNNNASYGNTYNSNWRNHPNFSWKPKPP
ncbi:hypothetical protein CK203_051876 [Vitis vinifera]|uniref:Retrotransposon gag domain-containing protein n=1 Tax=Vitis vinifera TaxID=29760 RepID=A0A438HAN2_VITVI|nr:hypothetical protein CK203_051876 [Vitis vinifera]